MSFEEFLKDINSEKYLYAENIREDDGSLMIDLYGTVRGTSDETDIAAIAGEFGEQVGEQVAELLKSSAPIDVNENRHWLVRFESYIGYSVINESFDSGDRATFERHEPVVTADDSDWLDYLKKSTFAFQIMDGIRHYQIRCLDHIINVAAGEPPVITKIQAE
ncbi:hypothetical protein [Ruminococcus albus]|uniref:Uncharacterized protein n=1 Tax=Ruminococcus albus TaxID=1264 RepID=A0A1H7KER8_RUMAL|nr:hypothetical protein [Ruminococcus albus]SEK85262.1 hypothetical protein SAMN05216469_106191 [Ruminococcus albus]